MSLAGTLTNIATQLITQFGEAVTLTRSVQGEYDPTTGETLPGDTVTYTAFGVPESYKSKEIDGVTVIKGDLKVTIYKTTLLPLVNDVITIAETDYRVLDVERIRAQGLDVIYQMQVRV